MDGPHYVEVHMQSWSSSKVWLKQIFFDKKSSHLFNIILSIASVLHLATKKI